MGRILGPVPVIQVGLGAHFGNNAPSSDSKWREELQKIRKIWGAWTLLPAFWILLAWPACADEDLDAAFPRDVLIIEAGDGTCYRFDIYLALDDPHRRRGLMFVRDLPATTGMLFVYDRDDYITMWMKNTYIPLDMVFARRDGTVSYDTHAFNFRSDQVAKGADRQRQVFVDQSFGFSVADFFLDRFP